MPNDKLYEAMHACKCNAEQAIRDFVASYDKAVGGNTLAEEITDIVYDATDGKVKLKEEFEN